MLTGEEQLRDLIHACEQEQHVLEERTHFYLQDTELDFLSAHHTQIGLGRINALLDILHKFQDNNHQPKTALKEYLTYLKTDLGIEQSIRHTYIPPLTISQAEQKLLKLEQQPLSPTPTSHLLQNAISQLLNRRMKNLKFWFDKEQKIVFNFHVTNKTLKISFPYIKHLRKRHTLAQFHEKLLHNLGFIESVNGNQLMCLINGDKDTIIKKTMQLLSKITFEVFIGLYSHKNVFLQYTEK